MNERDYIKEIERLEKENEGLKNLSENMKNSALTWHRKYDTLAECVADLAQEYAAEWLP